MLSKLFADLLYEIADTKISVFQAGYTFTVQCLLQKRTDSFYLFRLIKILSIVRS